MKLSFKLSFRAHYSITQLYFYFCFTCVSDGLRDQVSSALMSCCPAKTRSWLHSHNNGLNCILRLVFMKKISVL